MLIRMKVFGLTMAALLILALLPGAPISAAPPGSLNALNLTENAETNPSSGLSAPSAASAVQAAYAGLPLGFEANRGQFDEAVRFVTRHASGTFFFTPQEMACLFTREVESLSPGPSPHPGRGEGWFPLSQLWERGLGGEGPNDHHRPPERQGLALKVRFVGASPTTEMEGLDALPGVTNYFIGNDPGRWQRGVPTYRRIVYRQIYAGIDLVYHGSEGRLKYDFHLRPGAEVERIELAYAGPDRLRVSEAGQLEIETAWGVMVDEAPLAWQEADGERVPVEVRYTLRPGGKVGFAVGPYDAHKSLVIDPTLDYSTFVGGSGSDYGSSLAIDGSGNAVVTGFTFSPDFPTTAGAYDTSFNGGYEDVFVFKLSADGASLLYSTFVGGSDWESGYSLALDGSGNAVVTGGTWSSDFPTTAGAYDTSYNGYSDNFVFKLSADGTSLLYSTFVGGSSSDYGTSLAIDHSGNAVVTGPTWSSDFPTTLWAYDKSYNGYSDVFVFKLSANGRWLLYSTFVGGSGDDYGSSLAIDSHGKAVVTGMTYSTDFPTTPWSYDRSHNGGDDVFVLVLSANGRWLLYSTFVGGSGSDSGYSLDIDGAGNAVVTGRTASPDFPTTAGAYDRSHKSVFVFKLSANGRWLLYSTFVGGSGWNEGHSLALDGAGNAVITGGAESPYLATTAGAYDTSHNGWGDVFVLKLSADGSSLLYSTFVGGGDRDYGLSLAIDGAGKAVITGYTYSPDFPTTAGAYDRSNVGGDVFVLRLELLPEKIYLPLIIKDY